MAGGSELKAVRDVAALRGLQETAALGAVDGAGRVVRRVEALQSTERARQDERALGWAHSLADGGLSLTQAWSAAIRGGETELTSLGVRRADAEVGLESARTAWRAASARAAAANDLAKATERRFARARDERALAEVADRAARRGGRR